MLVLLLQAHPHSFKDGAASLSTSWKRMEKFSKSFFAEDLTEIFDENSPHRDSNPGSARWNPAVLTTTPWEASWWSILLIPVLDKTQGKEQPDDSFTIPTWVLHTTVYNRWKPDLLLPLFTTLLRNRLPQTGRKTNAVPYTCGGWKLSPACLRHRTVFPPREQLILFGKNEKWRQTFKNC